MIERQTLPEDLADLPPGPELAAVLASIDRTRLNGHDLVSLAEARARLAAWAQAELLADLAEIAHCPPGGPDSPPTRAAGAREFAADEIAFALAWTRRAAEGQLALAVEVTERLPQIHAAMRSGDVDLPKARVIVDAVAVLEEPAARAVVAEILPHASRLTTGALRARLQRMVLAADPGASRRRARARHRRATRDLRADSRRRRFHRRVRTPAGACRRREGAHRRARQDRQGGR